jgi:hypothetical protein
MCDESAAPIPGLEASEAIVGDHADATVRWTKGQYQQWFHKRVCLQIRLRQAELYSYWVQ